MADAFNSTEKEIVDKAMGDAPKPEKKSKKEKTSSYKLMTNQHIPISAKRGKFWQTRVNQAYASMDKLKDAWDEARSYFGNDQTNHRNGKKGNSISDVSKETENIVFSNVTSLIPRIYSKAPECEITPNFEDETLAAVADTLEKLGNVLAARKEAPGLNLKAKARRAIPITNLTNLAWAEIDYTLKAESSEQAMIDIQTLSKELEKADSADKIEEIEGKLMVIDEKFDLLEPSGPKLRVWEPERIVVDKATQEPDFSDAMWMAKWDYLPTSYIEAQFLQKDKEGKSVLVLKPDYVVRTKKGSGKDDNLQEDFTLFKTDEASAYGYTDKEEFEKAKRTKVWYVWDKVTRRVEMYLDSDWNWPVWVWNDPLKIERFFPFIPLTFITSVSGAYTKGEVSYYLDQQDAINEVNEMTRLARQWVKWNIWYNTRYINDQTMKKVLEGGAKTNAYGVSLPDGVKMEDAIYSVPPPSAQYTQLLDKGQYYQAIDRIASVNEMGRGGEYKTNTTNQAISEYRSVRGEKLDDKIDSLEEWIGEIIKATLELCIERMTAEEVGILLGPAHVQVWNQLTGLDGASKKRLIASLRVVGGSTLKPNSELKQEQANEVAQILGQFASATPYALVVALEVLSKAYDDMNITPEMWDGIKASIEQQLAPDPAATPQGAPAEGGQQAPQVSEEELRAFLETIPPEQKQQIVQLIQSGMSATEAITQVTGQSPV